MVLAGADQLPQSETENIGQETDWSVVMKYMQHRDYGCQFLDFIF